MRKSILAATKHGTRHRLVSMAAVGAAVMATMISAPAPAQAAVNCNRGSTHLTHLSAEVIAVGQQPGRQLIAYGVPATNDYLLIIVDDNPNLLKTQATVSMDIDPVNGVTWAKSVEIWGICKTNKSGQSVASLGSAVDVSMDCNALNSGNDWRSGCTVPGKTLLLQKNRYATELWFRKPAFLGVWVDADVMDSTFWEAFGGRSVRFIWRFN